MDGLHLQGYLAWFFSEHTHFRLQPSAFPHLETDVLTDTLVQLKLLLLSLRILIFQSSGAERITPQWTILKVKVFAYSCDSSKCHLQHDK